MVDGKSVLPGLPPLASSLCASFHRVFTLLMFFRGKYYISCLVILISQAEKKYYEEFGSDSGSDSQVLDLHLYQIY